MKTCKTCQEVKPLSSFYKQTVRGIGGARGTCKECDNLKKQTYRAKNREKRLAASKANYLANQERYLLGKKKYRQANKGKINALNAARKTVIKQRTPFWFTAIGKERIQNEYKLAALQTKITGEAWHVDHIIPLQGKLVSGLHVPSNLMAMRGVENISKKNKYEVKYA